MLLAEQLYVGCRNGETAHRHWTCFCWDTAPLKNSRSLHNQIIFLLADYAKACNELGPSHMIASVSNISGGEPLTNLCPL